jgi:RNA recognition motif-containing protein
MISRNTTEDELRHMFRAYGNIESVTVLRDGQGKSKGMTHTHTPWQSIHMCVIFTGCAFLTYSTRAEAIRAINALHHSTTMEVPFLYLKTLLNTVVVLFHCGCRVVTPQWLSSLLIQKKNGSKNG